MKRLRVLVTRPQPGTARTAARLEALGHEAVMLPLTEIVPLEPASLPDTAIDGVVLTSASAIREAPHGLVERLREVPAFVVGDRTAEAARQAGLASAQMLGATVAELARDLPTRLPPRSRLLYLAGRVRTGALEQELAPLGWQVTLLETYDTRVCAANVDAAVALIVARRVEVLLIHSGETARALAARLPPARLAAHVRTIAISRRAASPLLAAGWPVDCAGRPDEASILALLDAPEG